MAFAWPQATGDAFNGWATAEWDAEARAPRLRFVDMGRVQDGQLVTADEFLQLLLWSKIIDHVERLG
jgi:hypothetical protein